MKLKGLFSLFSVFVLVACTGKNGNKQKETMEPNIFFVNDSLIKYGIYPQSKVSDSSLLQALEDKYSNHTYSEIGTPIWQEYNGDYYVSMKNGSTISWYKCEQVEYEIIKANQSTTTQPFVDAAFPDEVNDYIRETSFESEEDFYNKIKENFGNKKIKVSIGEKIINSCDLVGISKYILDFSYIGTYQHFEKWYMQYPNQYVNPITKSVDLVASFPEEYDYYEIVSTERSFMYWFDHVLTSGDYDFLADNKKELLKASYSDYANDHIFKDDDYKGYFLDGEYNSYLPEEERLDSNKGLGAYLDLNGKITSIPIDKYGGYRPAIDLYVETHKNNVNETKTMTIKEYIETYLRGY